MMTSDVRMAELQRKADAYDDLMAWWSEFSDRCEVEEHTDTGAVWDVMGVEVDKWRRGQP